MNRVGGDGGAGLWAMRQTATQPITSTGDTSCGLSCGVPVVGVRPAVIEAECGRSRSLSSRCLELQ